jgi:hypothetical protein
MGKRMAFLVGINDYGEGSGLARLNYAEADAELMADTLKKVAGFSTKILLGNRAGITEIIKGLCSFYQEDTLDLFLFYFAGHGELIREVGMHCLHCYGSERGDIVGTLNIQDWATRIKKRIPAHRIVLMVDACRDRVYRGVRSTGSPGLDPTVPSALKEISNHSRGDISMHNYIGKKFLFTLLSCGIDQVSFEDDELGHGIFTDALVKEIRENGKELPLSKLSKKVGEYTFERCKKKGWYPHQIPEWIEPSIPVEVYLVDTFYSNLPDDDKFLGKAVSNIFDAHPSPYGTQGYIRRYEKGSIYFIGKMGNPKREMAKTMDKKFFRVKDSNIGNRYEALGGSKSKLGFPIGRVKNAWGSQKGKKKSRGVVQSFEGGNIYFCEGHGAHSLLVGSIKDLVKKSEQNVFETHQKQLTGGLFGFPVSEPMEVSSITKAVGNTQRFEYGLVIDWSGGAYGIVKGFYDVYQSLGEWHSPLGFPLNNEETFTSPVSGTKGSIQNFESGCIMWNEKTDRCLYIAGEIFSEWKHDIKRYGFPESNPYPDESCFKQLFEGEKIWETKAYYQSKPSTKQKNGTETVNKEKLNVKERNIPPQRFNQPFSLSKKQLDALRLIHEKLSRNLSSLLSFYLKAKVDVKLHTIEELMYSDFILFLPAATYISTILMKPLREFSILEIDPKILFPMIDILDGKGEEYSEETRTIDDLDKGLIDGLVKTILEGLGEGWKEVSSFNMIQTEIPTQSLTIFASSTKIVSISFELAVGPAQGFMHFCIPNALLQSIASELEKIDLLNIY